MRDMRDGPYLAHTDTIDQIEEIAGKNALVIYAGSGVSIDKTGLNWSALVSSMMATSSGTARRSSTSRR